MPRVPAGTELGELMGANKNPALRRGPEWSELRREPTRRHLKNQTSRGYLRLVFGRFAQHIAAAPDRFDIILAAGSVGELLAQLADEDVDDLELGLVHAA